MAGLRSGNAWRSSTLGTELDLACQEAYTWMAPNYDSSVQQLEAGITDHYRKEVFRGRPGTGAQSTTLVQVATVTKPYRPYGFRPQKLMVKCWKWLPGPWKVTNLKLSSCPWAALDVIQQYMTLTKAGTGRVFPFLKDGEASDFWDTLGV